MIFDDIDIVAGGAAQC